MRTGSRQNLFRTVGTISLGGALLLGVVGAAPAEVTVSSQVDKVRLTMEEPLTFSVTIAGPIKTSPRVHLASLKGFQVISTGQSQQVSLRGGQTQLAVTLQYLLAPTEPGKHRLGPVTVEYEGQRYETAALEVEVLPPPEADAPRARAGERPEEPKRRPRIRGGMVL